MLNDTDIAPSASINRWIVSILTFHFELQHVPSKVHGPDGLSQQPPQPDNDSNGEETDEEAEEFEDWTHNLYGFVHLVNRTIAAPHTEQFLLMLALEKMMAHPYVVPDLPSDEPNYNVIPRSIMAVKVEMHLEMVHEWLTFLECLDGLSDQEHEQLI